MSPLRSLMPATLVIACLAAVALLSGCGGGDETPESTYMPVNCGQPGACL